MQPLFRHFGSKWRMAKYYGPPRRDLVVEPFAGSACYSLYWNCPNVKLADLDESVCLMWEWLIQSSEADVKALPDWIDDWQDVLALPTAVQHLLSRFIFHSPSPTLPTNPSLGYYKRFVAVNRDGVPDPLNKYTNRQSWCPALKQRILRAKSMIRSWTIDCLSYNDLDNTEAHWFVDPPYQKLATSKYVHGRNGIDFRHLAEWCQDRVGSVCV